MAVSSTRSDGLAQMTISHLLPAENAASYPSEADDPVQQVLLVDVGGGRGQIIDNVRKKRPELRGRMIVQDLPREIEGREPCEGVECMAHDFFTPQPIMGTYEPGRRDSRRPSAPRFLLSYLHIHIHIHTHTHSFLVPFPEDYTGPLFCGYVPTFLPFI